MYHRERGRGGRGGLNMWCREMSLTTAALKLIVPLSFHIKELGTNDILYKYETRGATKSPFR